MIAHSSHSVIWFHCLALTAMKAAEPWELSLCASSRSAEVKVLLNPQCKKCLVLQTLAFTIHAVLFVSLLVPLFFKGGLPLIEAPFVCVCSRLPLQMGLLASTKTDSPLVQCHYTARSYSLLQKHNWDQAVWMNGRGCQVGLNSGMIRAAVNVRGRIAGHRYCSFLNSSV